MIYCIFVHATGSLSVELIVQHKMMNLLCIPF